MKSSMKARLTNVGNTLLAFPTPILQARYERTDEFNMELARRVLALREKSPGLQRSNIGAWHSESTFPNDVGEPYGSQLGKMFAESVRAAVESMVEMTGPWPEKFRIDIWANVHERGHSHVPHVHPGCPWTGVYYVATETNAGGEIVFSDPRTAALMIVHPLNPFNTTNMITIAPVAGMMLVFPSFVYHSVRPYEGTTPRISISFDLL